MVKLGPYIFGFSSKLALRFLKTRARTTIAVVAAIAMMRTTATTPPMKATVTELSELDGSIDTVGGVDMLSPVTSDAGAAQDFSPNDLTCMG